MSILQTLSKAILGPPTLDLPADEGTNTPALSVDDMDTYAYAGQQHQSNYDYSVYDGGKFAGGFGETQIQYLDYWTMRARSSQLFNENLYAKGILDRLVTNVINTGLTPEACPDEQTIGENFDREAWSEITEGRYALWAKTPAMCDYYGELTFGALQRKAYLEALIEGDVLIVNRHNRVTGLPSIQLVKGSAIQTPLAGDSKELREGHDIRHGIEFNSKGRRVAFWVRQKDGDSKRIPVKGAKSGRRMAWMIYGTDRRLDEVRGQPLLTVVLQSLKEIDRYRDSTMRKAFVNSLLAMFIKKGEDKIGSLPMTGGAVRRGEVQTTNTSGERRSFNIAQAHPGMMIEELQHGEEPVAFGNDGTDVNFGTFEESIIQGVAWALGIPPEILRLTFSNNYSASQAAINEFKIAINYKWGDLGDTLCSPVYVEWLISETLLQKIKAPGLLQAWRDPKKMDVFAAWCAVDWYGSIKPSTDMFKQAKASEKLLELGLTTYARESRVTTGTKFSKNLKRQKAEIEQIVETMRPLLELKQELRDSSRNGGEGMSDASAVLEALEDSDASEDTIAAVSEALSC